MKNRWVKLGVSLLAMLLVLQCMALAEVNVLMKYDSQTGMLDINCTGLRANKDYSLMILYSGTSLTADNVVLIDQLTTTASGRLNIGCIRGDTLGCTVLLGGVFDGESSPYNAGIVEENDYSTMLTPAALQVIEEEAFVGNAFNYFYIGDEVHTIGARAFKDCTELMKISIPSSVTSIGEDVFSGCSGVVISCTEGSTAHQYALDNNIACELR